jgi:uncharacterized membrane protein YgcG
MQMLKKNKLLKQALLAGVIFLFTLVGFASRSHAADQYVDDQAHVLKEQTVRFINNKNKHLKQGQIYVVTVKTTGGQPIDQAAAQYFKRHHLGKNATMLMYAIKDRKVHFEKGSKIGEMFSDRYLGTILTSHVKKDFQNDNYDAGVQLMVDRLTDSLNGEDDNDSPATQSTWSELDSMLSVFGAIGFIVFGFIWAIVKLFSGDARDDSYYDRDDSYYDRDYRSESGFIDSSDSDSGSNDSGDTGSW